MKIITRFFCCLPCHAANVPVISAPVADQKLLERWILPARRMCPTLASAELPSPTHLTRDSCLPFKTYPSTVPESVLLPGHILHQRWRYKLRLRVTLQDVPSGCDCDRLAHTQIPPDNTDARRAGLPITETPTALPFLALQT